MKTQKGITLVALVITIIVMLILVGVTVSVSLNGGLFSTAKEATGETQAAKESEELLMAAMGALGENGEVLLSKLDNSLPEGFEKTGEGTYKSSTGNIFTVATNGKIVLVGSSSEEEPETPVVPPVTPTITISPETITAEIDSEITKTEVGTITATVTNVDGDLTWSITPEDSGLELVDTDNENVKKVTASKAVENATITVSYGDISDACSVTITEKEELITITFEKGESSSRFYSLTKDSDYVYCEEIERFEVMIPAGTKVEGPSITTDSRILTATFPMSHSEYSDAFINSSILNIELPATVWLCRGVTLYQTPDGEFYDLGSFYPEESVTIYCYDD